jgi:phospholipase/carboxylesterase
MSRFHTSFSWHFPTGNNESHGGNQDEQHEHPHALSEADDEAFLAGNGEHDFFAASALASVASPQTFFVPVHYEPNYRYPLIVWLHSDGFNENQIDHVMPHVSTRNYLATGVRGTRAADSAGHRFDWHESPTAIDAAHDKVLCAIDEACDRYSVHRDRIVLAGYRSGGTMAMRIAMRQPELVAAVASLGGPMPRGGKLLSNLPSLRKRRLPMLWQVATASASFDARRLKTDIQSAMLVRAKVEIRQYGDDDEMNTAALSDFNNWIMSRVVNREPASAEQWQSSPACFSSN